MTLEKLSQAYYLQKEIKLLEGKLIELYNKALPASAPVSAPVKHGVTRKVEDIAVEIASLTDIIHDKYVQRIQELKEITQWINDIPDSRTRMIFTLRFLNGLSWGEVAQAMGGHTPTVTVKTVCYNYLDKAAADSSPA